MVTDTSTLEQIYSQYSALEINTILIGFIIGALLAAFFSFRFLKLSIVISAALTGYEFGAVTLGAALGEGIDGLMPQWS